MDTFREEGLKGSLPGGILLLILYGQFGQNPADRTHIFRLCLKPSDIPIQPGAMGFIHLDQIAKGRHHHKTAHIAVSGVLELRAIRTPTENHYS